MRLFSIKISKGLASLALVMALIGGATAQVNAASSGSKTINSTYGTLTGQVIGSIFVDAKNINTNAKTTKNVPRLMADVEIQYYKTGRTICHEGTCWKTNANQTGTDVDMSHYKNVLNKNIKDDFLNTKLTAYGCAEAIVKKAYTVYTSCTY